MQDFFREWGVSHRISSACYAQSNGRDEVAVKSAKRILQDSMSASGSLDTNKFLLALRDSSDQESGLSPVEVIYGYRNSERRNLSTINLST